jgi:leader peptidase (prepilin peptidase)/N-methyltransferase
LNPLPLAAIVGALVGSACWAAASRLTAEARLGKWDARALLPVSAFAGAVLLMVSALRSEGDPMRIAVVAILAAPILTTLLTDLLARLVYPVVLLPGLLAALALAAAGAPVLPALPAALATGVIAGGIAALFAAFARWRWPEAEETPLGSGDALIAATAGAMLGPERAPAALFAGMALGAVAAALLLVTHRADPEDPIPYGAFLCAATLAALAL